MKRITFGCSEWVSAVCVMLVSLCAPDPCVCRPVTVRIRSCEVYVYAVLCCSLFGSGYVDLLFRLLWGRDCLFCAVFVCCAAIFRPFTLLCRLLFIALSLSSVCWIELENLVVWRESKGKCVAGFASDEACDKLELGSDPFWTYWTFGQK